MPLPLPLPLLLLLPFEVAGGDKYAAITSANAAVRNSVPNTFSGTCLRLKASIKMPNNNTPAAHKYNTLCLLTFVVMNRNRCFLFI